MADATCALVIDPAPAGQTAPVMVAFGGLANGTDDPPFEFVRQTGDLGVHRVFVRDLGQCWYQQGISGAGDSVVAAAAALSALLDTLSPSRRVFVGNSSGAFAAILYGILASADEVVAFGPQASITRFGRLRSRDRRWPAQIHKARQVAADRSHLDLVRLLRTTAHPGRITVHHGEKDLMDTRSAARLGAESGVEVATHPGGHLFIRKLRDGGELQPMLEVALRSPGSTSAPRTG